MRMQLRYHFHLALAIPSNNNKPAPNCRTKKGPNTIPARPKTNLRLGQIFSSGLEDLGRDLRLVYLPLVSREWKNGSNSSYNCTPFLHSLLTKGKFKACPRAQSLRECDSRLWRVRGLGLGGWSEGTEAVESQISGLAGPQVALPITARNDCPAKRQKPLPLGVRLQTK